MNSLSAVLVLISGRSLRVQRSMGHTPIVLRVYLFNDQEITTAHCMLSTLSRAPQAAELFSPSRESFAADHNDTAQLVIISIIGVLYVHTRRPRYRIGQLFLFGFPLARSLLLSPSHVPGWTD